MMPTRSLRRTATSAFAQRQKQRQILRRQAAARGQRDVAGTNVFAGLANVGAVPGHGLQHQRVAVAFAVFLHHDRVGAVRNHRTGRDARGATDRQAAGERDAGRRLADDASLAFASTSACRKAPAVDAGIVEGRQGQRSRNVGRQRAADRVGQANLLDLGDRLYARCDQRQRVGDRVGPSCESAPGLAHRLSPGPERGNRRRGSPLFCRDRGRSGTGVLTNSAIFRPFAWSNRAEHGASVDFEERDGSLRPVAELLAPGRILSSV